MIDNFNRGGNQSNKFIENNSNQQKTKLDKKFNPIQYRITEVTSEEESNPVAELLNHTPYCRGWHSARFCQYPQEITLEFGQKVCVKQIQFLSHQYKISTKIELMIFNPGQTKKFKKIGYLALDSNERSNFQARELKSVYINHECQMIKILLNKNHPNDHNIFNQVGLISINVQGEYLNKNTELFSEGQENIKNKTDIDNFEDNVRYDQKTLDKLKTLIAMKDEAIAKEDFDAAKNIKDAISRLKSVGNKIVILEEKKQIAVKNDKFDEAKLLKNEIEKLRNQAANVDMNSDYNNFKNKNVENKSDVNQTNIKKLSSRPESFDDNNFKNNKNNTNYNDDFNNQNMNDALNSQNQNPNVAERKTPNSSNLGNKTPKMENLTKTKFEKELENEKNDSRNDLATPQNSNNNRNKNPKTSNQNSSNKNLSNMPIDIDNMVIKGNNQNFDDYVQEQIKNDKQSKPTKKVNDNENGDEDDIPEKEYGIAEPLIAVFSYDLVKMLFSKNWKNKEEGIKLIKQELTKFPKSNIISSDNTPAKILTAVLGVGEYIFSNITPQPSIAAIDLIKTAMVKFKGENLNNPGYAKGDFISKSEKTIGLLLEKTIDANPKLKENAEILINDYADSQLIGPKIILNFLIGGKVKKNLVNSAKHLTSRLNLLNRNLELYTIEPVDDLDGLINFAIACFKNPNKDLRDTAYNLLMTIYKFVGDDVKKHFKDLRQAQISTLEEGFDGIEFIGINPNPSNRIINKNLINEKQNNNSAGNQKSSKPETPNSAIVNNNTQQKNSAKNQQKNALPEESIQEPEHDQNYEMINQNQQACSFCGYFDQNFDEDSLALHLYKECPWLINCSKCKQTIEICSLNYHYINECEMKKNFRVCSRCKEPIIVNLYDKHVNEKSCLPAKNQNVAQRCLLCHSDVEPPGKKGWEIHLLEEGCTNNPRSKY